MKVKNITIPHQTTYLKLSSNENLSFSEFFTLAKKIANFLIFAINRQVSIDEITVNKVGLNKLLINGKESDIPENIQVYTNQLLHTQNLKEIHWNTMMFRYRDIDNFENTNHFFVKLKDFLD